MYNPCFTVATVKPNRLTNSVSAGRGKENVCMRHKGLGRWGKDFKGAEMLWTHSARRR